MRRSLGQLQVSCSSARATTFAASGSSSCISAADSPAEVFVLPTGEEGVIARPARALVARRNVGTFAGAESAFDPVDASVSLDRQKESLSRVHALVTCASAFPRKEAAREHFTRLTGLLKNLNYADARSPEHADLLARIEALSASAP